MTNSFASSSPAPQLSTFNLYGLSVDFFCLFLIRQQEMRNIFVNLFKKLFLLFFLMTKFNRYFSWLLVNWFLSIRRDDNFIFYSKVVFLKNHSNSLTHTLEHIHTWNVYIFPFPLPLPLLRNNLKLSEISYNNNNKNQKSEKNLLNIKMRNK